MSIRPPLESTCHTPDLTISQFDMQFPVIILPGLESKEQVFHFYVLNNKAQPVNRTHLRRIISTALSKKEIEELYERFKQAGVEAKSAEWTHRMNNDESSPFKGLIQQFKGGKGAIAENVAYQVVSKFMSLDNRYKLLVEGVSQWHEDDPKNKLEAFYKLWHAVKKMYPDAWQQAVDNGPKGDGIGQLFYKVSLIVLQDYLLESLHKEMPKNKVRNIPSPLKNLNVFQEEVELTLPFLSEDFFMKQWMEKGLDTGPGRSFFREQINRAIQNESKNLGNMKLFRRD